LKLQKDNGGKARKGREECRAMWGVRVFKKKRAIEKKKKPGGSTPSSFFAGEDGPRSRPPAKGNRPKKRKGAGKTQNPPLTKKTPLWARRVLYGKKGYGAREKRSVKKNGGVGCQPVPSYAGTNNHQRKSRAGGGRQPNPKEKTLR